MRLITALTVQQRNQERVNVYLDEQYAFSLALPIAARLKVGQSLSAEEIASLQEKDSFEKAKQSAIRLIAHRPRSVAEVERQLRTKGFDEAVVTSVVDHLQEVELLDDRAFTRYWVEQRETFKPRSSLALRQELQQKGVSRQVIDEVLSGLDETAAARRAAIKQARRWTNLPEDLFRVKLGQFLQRRGFHYEIINQVTDDVWQAIEADTLTDDIDAVT